MKNIKIYFALLFLLTGMKAINAQPPNNDPAYTLVWADSFGQGNNALDTNKWKQIPPWNQADSVVWNYATGTYVDRAYNKWYRSTPVSYPPDTTNCKINSGNLNLYTRKENFSGECWDWNHSCTPISNCNMTGNCDFPSTQTCGHKGNKQFKYTSGEIISKYKFKYGYFEIKFKLPSFPTRGDCGPAFWLWDADCNTVPWSEIDIMELRGSDNLFTSNVHYTHSPTPCGSSPAYSNYLPYTTISTGAWHTAGCLWTSNEISFFLDGQRISTVTKKTIRPDSLLPMPIICGIASPNANFGNQFDPSNGNDYLFQVDYIKVWQIQRDCNTAKTYCGPATPLNPATYTSKLYQSITVDGSTCVDAITNTGFLSLYGNSYVLLDQGFSIDNNSTVLIDVQDCPANPFFYTGAAPPQPPQHIRIPSDGNPFPPQ